MTDNQRTPRTLPTRERITETLSEVIYERGNRVSDWPADEAETYRKWRDRHSISEAHRQVQKLIVQKAADAVLALIDKENTMLDEPTTEEVMAEVDKVMKMDAELLRRLAPHDGPVAPDDTIPVPRALIEAAAEQIHCSALASQLTDLIPKPPAPRLRVVQLGEEHHTYETIRHETAHVFVDLEAQPDVLTVIDETIDEWTAAFMAGDLKARIRAALGLAS